MRRNTVRAVRPCTRCSVRSAPTSPKHLHRFGPGLAPGALRRDLRRLDEETGLPEAPLMRGARTLLNRLRDAGIPTDLVTSGGPKYARHHRTRLGVAGHFKALVTADDVTHGNPDPEGYLLACRRLGVDPRQALVFEDSAAGIQAARASGAACTTAWPTPRRSGRWLEWRVKTRRKEVRSYGAHGKTDEGRQWFSGVGLSTWPGRASAFVPCSVVAGLRRAAPAAADQEHGTHVHSVPAPTM